MSSTSLEPEVQEIIRKIAVERRGGAFAYFTADDIEQEVWRICLDVLEGYEEERGPLENYLRRCVTNRLKNLRRDRYFRPAKADDEQGMAAVRTRINLVNALPMGCGDIAEAGSPVAASSLIHFSPVDQLLGTELLEELLARIDPELRADLADLVEGGQLPERRAEKVRAAVRVILEELNG